jgi:signal transduction histidine kinase
MTIGSNLSFKIAAILILGFVLFQALILAMMALPADGGERQRYNLPQPMQFRTMVETIEAAPPARRAALIDLFDGSLYSVRLAQTAPPAPATRRAGLDALERRYEAALPGHAVDISGRRPLLGGILGEGRRGGRFFKPVTLSVSVRGGGVLVVDSRPSAIVRARLRERALIGVLGGLAILLVLLLAVRQATRPLVRLATGVRRFSSDLTTPDVPVDGSREMRELSLAFNEMKAQIGVLMAERTRMLAGIAHDMRTYLTRLRLRVDFIDDPAQRAKAGADLDELSALLDDTLLFARRDTGAAPAPVCVDLAMELIALGELRREMGEAVDIAPMPALAVAFDRTALRRMLANLVDNGIRHGGQVRIAAHTEGGWAVVTVQDYGLGVPDAALPRLGEPFGRLDPSRDRETGGAGLGLAIVRALAEREGATVEFANGSAGGLIVTLRFPLW